MSTLRENFGNRVRYLRRQAGLTQEELANRVGFSVDFLSLVERGINSPSFENIENLSRALDVTVQELFNFQNG